MAVLEMIFSILVGLLLLGLMMFLHELGHYAMGRLLGFKILEFSIFMGPRLISWERRGIRYSLKCIPIGASVRFAGEDLKESEDEFEKKSEKSELDTKGDFYKRPRWARALVVAAGPAVNLICGVLALFIFFSFIGFTEPILSKVDSPSQLEEAGLQAGDRILSWNGHPIRTDWDLKSLLYIPDSFAPPTLVYERGKEIYKTKLVDRKVMQHSLGIQMKATDKGFEVVESKRSEGNENTILKVKDVLISFDGQEVSRASAQNFWRKHPGQPLPVTLLRAGVQQTLLISPLEIEQSLPLGLNLRFVRNWKDAFGEAFQASWSMTKMTFRSISAMIQGRLSARENLSGPVGIVSTLSSVVRAPSVDWTLKAAQLLFLFALLSLTLGIMNLLPIPPLDGNILLLTAVEGILRRTLPEKFRMILTVLGIVLIALLFVLGLYFDLARLMQ